MLILVVVLAFLFLFGAEKLSNFRLLDFEHYLEASRRIWSGASPYNGLEYFAPPWFAALLLPLALLSPDLAAMLWLLLLVISVFLSLYLWLRFLSFSSSARSGLWVAALLVLAPYSLYCYITGQSSPFVLLSMVYVLTLRELPEKLPYIVSLFLSVVGMTIKPHLVVFPMMIFFADKIRHKQTGILIVALLSLGLLLIGTFWLYPRWWSEWIFALRQGNYRGGYGLVAEGYVGLREIGVPSWLLVLPLLYTTFFWWKEGCSARVMSLAIVSNLIFIPYSRAYDLVFLYLPLLMLWKEAHIHPKCNWCVGMGIFSVLGLGVTPLALSSPLWLAIPLLRKPKTERSQLDPER